MKETWDPSGPADTRTMRIVHNALRRDLARAGTVLRTAPCPHPDQRRALATHLAWMMAFLHHHHSGEDAGLWPALMDRTDEEGRATLEAMEAEHSEIDPILEACAAGLQRLAEHPDDDARAALAVRLVAARERLAEHLKHEETEAIALIQALLTPEEWEAITKEHFDADVSFREILRLVPWVAHGLPDAVLRELFAKPGGPVHKVMLRLTRRRFERLEVAAFGSPN